MTLMAKLVTELVGSFVFMTVIALSGGIGSLAPLAIGLALTAMVYMGGHVSGAHYNPAVSLGLFLRKVIDARTMAAYWGTQILAALLAFTFAYLLTGRAAGVHPGSGVSWLSALAAEVVFTAALVTVIFNVAATRATAGNSFYGIAIGFTVAAGAFAVGPISGAAFNPAVGIGSTLVGVVAGHGSWADLWLYIVGPLAGAALGAGIHAIQTPAEPVTPESSERRLDSAV
jgi:aquaporin Z